MEQRLLEGEGGGVVNRYKVTTGGRISPHVLLCSGGEHSLQEPTAYFKIAKTEEFEPQGRSRYLGRWMC